jgi:hypothetical protein
MAFGHGSRTKPASAPTQVWIIMANDFPHMVKSTKGAAKRWVDKANKEQERIQCLVSPGVRLCNRIYYRYYEATVDGGPIR